MISIKTEREIELMRVAGEIVGDTHKYLIPYLKPGITTKKIDSLARDYIIKRGATPSCYHYDGYIYKRGSCTWHCKRKKAM